MNGKPFLESGFTRLPTSGDGAGNRANASKGGNPVERRIGPRLPKHGRWGLGKKQGWGVRANMPLISSGHSVHGPRTRPLGVYQRAPTSALSAGDTSSRRELQAFYRVLLHVAKALKATNPLDFTWKFRRAWSRRGYRFEMSGSKSPDTKSSLHRWPP